MNTCSINTPLDTLPKFFWNTSYARSVCRRAPNETRDRTSDLQIFSLTPSQPHCRGRHDNPLHEHAPRAHTRIPVEHALWERTRFKAKVPCRDPGSNRGVSDLQSDALPTELSRLVARLDYLLYEHTSGHSTQILLEYSIREERMQGARRTRPGIEPATFRSSV